MAHEISREDYAARYGPTAGDRIRLGDTSLLALIERDDTSYGDEVLRGWGKTMRTGLMMSDRQMQYLVEEADWSRQGEEVAAEGGA